MFFILGVFIYFKSLKANLDDSNSPPALTTAVPSIPPVIASTTASTTTGFAAFQQAQLADQERLPWPWVNQGKAI